MSIDTKVEYTLRRSKNIALTITAITALAFAGCDQGVPKPRVDMQLENDTNTVYAGQQARSDTNRTSRSHFYPYAVSRPGTVGQSSGYQSSGVRESSPYVPVTTPAPHDVAKSTPPSTPHAPSTYKPATPTPAPHVAPSSVSRGGFGGARPGSVS